MVQLLEWEAEEDESVTITLSVPANDVPALSALVEEGNVPWEDIEPSSALVALQMQLYLQKADAPPLSVRIVVSEEGGDDAEMNQDADHVGQEQCDNEYFLSYQDMTIHELMLRDKPRMEAYRNAMMKNRHLFEGKAVLDVGTGTGVLSMFAAQAGARVVYAVEASNVAGVAQKLVEANALDKIVKVMRGKMEDVEIPEKVDIIISEWMGFYLLHETMLPSVLRARDRWLKPGGVVMPSACRLYAAPCCVYGNLAPDLDFSFLSSFSNAQPKIMNLSPERLCSSPALLFEFDCSTMQESDLVSMKASATVCASRDTAVDGLCVWFEVDFAGHDVQGERITLTTAPDQEATHWMQTVVALGTTAVVQQGSEMPFSVLLEQDAANRRRYLLSVTT